MVQILYSNLNICSATLLKKHTSNPFLLPPKLQRRGLVFEGKMVTMERVMGYYGTCDGLL